MSTACYHAFQPSPADPGQRNRSFASQEYCNNGPPTRISLWSQLPGLIPINSLWNAHPASVTFYWFNSLLELLHIFHCWIKAQRYHQTQGFTTASDSQGAMHIQLVDTLPSHIPGKSTHLMEAVARFDTQFQQRWYNQEFNLSDPLWTSAPPAEHFVRSNPGRRGYHQFCQYIHPGSFRWRCGCVSTGILCYGFHAPSTTSVAHAHHFSYH